MSFKKNITPVFAALGVISAVLLIYPASRRDGVTAKGGPEPVIRPESRITPQLANQPKSTNIALQPEALRLKRRLNKFTSKEGETRILTGTLTRGSNSLPIQLTRRV